MLLWVPMLSSCGFLGLPDADVQDVILTSLGLEEASLEVAVAVDNPLWVELPVDSFRWELTVADQVVAQGDHPTPIVLGAGESTRVPIPVTFRYDDLWNAATASVADQVTYEVVLYLEAWTPRGTVVVPVRHTGQIPRLRFPTVDLVDLDISRVGSSLTVVVAVHLGLPEGLVVARLDWAAYIDATRLGHGGVTIGEDGGVRIPVTFEAYNVASASWAWMWGETRELVLDLAGEVVTPLGTVPFSADRRIPLGDVSTPPAP